MDPQIWEKVLLLVAGGVLTMIGAWVNDLRSERRRKSTKLEEAYLTWLNTQSKVAGQLKELTRLAENEPNSVESHELLLEKFENLYSEIHNLTSALNLAFLYERNKNKRNLIEIKSSSYALLTEWLRIIISHHRRHLDFHKTINKANSLVSSLEKELNSESVSVNENSSKEIKNKYLKAKSLRDEAIEHLSTCSVTLFADAKQLSEKIKDIEEDSPIFRRILVDGK